VPRGAILILSYEADFDGTFSADGANGVAKGVARGGGGSGGTIKLSGDELDFNVLSAIGGLGATGDGADGGNGGVGRIAIYAYDSEHYNSSNPTPGYSGTVTSTPTAPVGWLGAQYAYQSARPHAVSSVNRGDHTDEFTYDDNGNMTTRIEGGVTWTQSFNAENRLASVSNGTDTWSFTYDGDGNRVKQVGPEGTTIFLGGAYTKLIPTSGSPSVTKYYVISGQRVAMRKDGTLSYLLTDHLGSVSAVVDGTGTLISQQRYEPFGAERPGEGITQTDFGFTGQRDLAAAGLMDYNARWYSETVGVFTQPDMVSNFASPQALNRFSYVGDNPLNRTDPTGNISCPDYDPNCNGGPQGSSGSGGTDQVYCDVHVCNKKRTYTDTIPAYLDPRRRKYNSRQSANEAMGLILNWFTGLGNEGTVFYPDNSLTLDIIHEPGMDEFRKVWASTGYELPFAWHHEADNRNGIPGSDNVFINEHIINPMRVLLGGASTNPSGTVDLVGASIGSLDTISVRDGGNGNVLFSVENVMGLASGSRIPNTNISIFQNAPRGSSLFGGTTYQFFFWMEHHP
jgi:RHS repeat-associated protein